MVVVILSSLLLSACRSTRGCSSADAAMAPEVRRWWVVLVNNCSENSKMAKVVLNGVSVVRLTVKRLVRRTETPMSVVGCWLLVLVLSAN